jgi:hypothetical protein
MNKIRQKGPIELLCAEIGFRFQPAMETDEMLVSFVSELVRHILDMRKLAIGLSEFTGKSPSNGSKKAINNALAMLAVIGKSEKIRLAANLHSLCDELNPEDALPTDHLIDMISSCASAIRFGFEFPCQSRHAAHAAQHIWRQKYRISLFDSHSSKWEKDWICSVLQDAILAQVPSQSASQWGETKQENE